MAYEPESRRIFIIISENHRSNADRLTTLCHECFHATCSVMRNADIHLSKKSEEAFAYYLDFVFEKCLNRLADMGL